jgi:hypothetical protein
MAVFFATKRKFWTFLKAFFVAEETFPKYKETKSIFLRGGGGGGLKKRQKRNFFLWGGLSPMNSRINAGRRILGLLNESGHVF